MASSLTSPTSRPTARRKDPACGTCRKKCRKCDRRRPICDRCRTRGLVCEGYPPRFQFQETLVVSSRRQTPPETTQHSVQVTPTRSVVSDEPPVESPAIPGTTVANLSPPNTLLDPSASSLQSPLSSNTPPFSPTRDSPVASFVEDNDLQNDIIANQLIIDHFDQTLSEHLTIHAQGIDNHFRQFILPLIYEHQGILHALLGLSACHMHMSGKDSSQRLVTISLQYRLSALRSLASLLLKEETCELTRCEEKYILAMVLLLVLHDVCETGVSSHGAHLTGVSFLCKRVACPNDFIRSKGGMFLISALAWLDMLRGFSGPEKLSYSEDVRECVRDHASLSLHTLVGCPPAVFYKIGQVLQAGKSFRAGDLSVEEFQQKLDEAERFFRGWDPDQVIYPTRQPEWRHLAEAYRHACLLRIMRFPDTYAVSCDDPRIKASVTAILDVAATVPRDSVFYKRLLFPLFMAGADTCSPYQMHYASWCISEIKQATGFQHPAMTEVLTKVWEERRTNPRGRLNVPWMEFTCSELLSLQHAYLFF
ncbi:hypothetical protein F66182_7952 [Fusarium sp. NRRL 66182]|nr:hypothetical protein F66182_7952 [Fusarium sp. NRRL 66182]